MENTPLVSGVLYALCAFLLACTWKVFNLVWLNPKKLERCLRQQGLAGTPYRLLIGDVKETTKMTKQAQAQPMSEFSNDIAPRVLPFLLQSIRQYGKCSYTWMGPTPVISIMEPEMIKEILSKVEFEKPHIKGIGELLISGLVTAEGEKWAKNRKILNPAFHLEKLKHVACASHISCEEMMKKWEALLLGKESCEVDIWEYISNLTGDVISRAAFASSYEEGQKIFLLQREQIDLFFKIIYFAFIPGWRFLPTKTNKRLEQINFEIKSLVRCIINKREKAMKEGDMEQDDLLGILLKSNLREIQESGSGEGMSIEEVIDECKIFYLAGQETTSGMLGWAMILLSKHKDWQDKARAEVLQVYGNNKPDFEGLRHLKILNMILNEVLRLYPPAVRLTRTVHKTTKIGNMILPAGVQLFLPTLLIHHDQDLWGSDAHEFKPERFSEGISKATKNRLTFFPFSWGPRTCIGQNFSLIEAKVVLAMVLQNFSMEMSPSYKHSPISLLSLHNQYGAALILRKIV